jgi:hypothetical protein
MTLTLSPSCSSACLRSSRLYSKREEWGVEKVSLVRKVDKIQVLDSRDNLTVRLLYPTVPEFGKRMH